ncbi:MAG: ABC transporter ATP-binding protein [Verrucomicrobiota bacterium]
MSAGLSLRGVSFLDWKPVSIEVGEGECVGISGASGSGKSLLLRAIADLDVNEGDVRLGDVGREAVEGPVWRSLVGMLPAEPRWWEERVGAHFGREIAETLERLERFGFSGDVMEWEVRRLSVGERQRLGLVRMLESNPRALLLDEPTANLDEDNTRVAEEMIAAYRDGERAPVLWVSHNEAQLSRVSRRVLVMKGKELAAAE